MVNPLSQSISQSRWEHKYFFLALLFSGIIDRFLKSKSELYIWRLCPIQISFSFFFFQSKKHFLLTNGLPYYVNATYIHTAYCYTLTYWKMYVYLCFVFNFVYCTGNSQWFSIYMSLLYLYASSCLTPFLQLALSVRLSSFHLNPVALKTFSFSLMFFLSC